MIDDQFSDKVSSAPDNQQLPRVYDKSNIIRIYSYQIFTFDFPTSRCDLWRSSMMNREPYGLQVLETGG